MVVRLFWQLLLVVKPSVQSVPSAQSVLSAPSVPSGAMPHPDKPPPTPSLVFRGNYYQGAAYVSGIFDDMGKWCLEHGISMQVNCLRGFHKIQEVAYYQHANMDDEEGFLVRFCRDLRVVAAALSRGWFSIFLMARKILHLA